ncbi:MAG TPA: HPr(Ser) kinase/phosphatase [Gemmatimonadaceae bacterium]|nr:HPr(Ser) kinase/phosphatase [Gemmatimonadaceae bacterium]
MSAAASPVVTVGKVIERLREILDLEQLGNVAGAERAVATGEISSPGLALAGFVGRFVSDRLQVLGETEIAYLRSLGDAERHANLQRFCEFGLPCVFITKGQDPVPPLLELMDAHGIPVYRAKPKTAEFYRLAKPAIEELFAPTTTLHGSLADVFGVGLLFTGASGIGKSECVLDLVERGHRLVADDLVLVTRRGNDVLIGRGHPLQRHVMEIRGVGLIDISHIFGVRAVRQQKRIEVVVQLVEWTEHVSADRTGLDGENTDILGVSLPKITVYLNPGKNITVIAEVIAMNHLLKYSGMDTAQVFNERLITHMRAASEVRQYLVEDDE